MTSSFEFNTYPARLSDAERDHALKVLRDGVAMGRLSHDTFIRRMVPRVAAFWQAVQDGTEPTLDGQESTRQALTTMVGPPDSGRGSMTFRIKREKGKWVLAVDDGRPIPFGSFKAASNYAVKRGASGGWTKEEIDRKLVYVDRKEVPNV